MRVKKHKATRRIVRYFKLHFGFREPFKVRKEIETAASACYFNHSRLS